MADAPDDSFELYDLKVEIVAGDRPMMGEYKAGDYFILSGEMMTLPPGQGFPIYAFGCVSRSCPCCRRSSAKRTRTTG
jgi:uncharacterized repeat protein (TIGR04076 family)